MPTASVLLLSDQDRHRLPTHCVLSGEPTDDAVQVWAVASSRVRWLVGLGGLVGVGLARLAGLSVRQVAVPVSERAFGIWSRRQSISFSMVVFGATALAFGLVRSASGVAVFGALFIVGAPAFRARSFFNFWFSAELRVQAGHIVIQPAHEQFDADARRLFSRGRR